VATRKATGLLQAGARVTVVSPQVDPSLEKLAARGEIELARRPYRAGDLQDALLVIAATNEPEINQQVWEEATARGILVNVVDDPARCTFIAPSVVRRGPLTLAISTAGRSPALARHLRQQLQQQFGPPYGPFVELLGALRAQVHTHLPPERQAAFWKALFHSDVLSLLDSGEGSAARQRAEEILSQHLEGAT